MQKVFINNGEITLAQFLKKIGIVQTGGQCKYFLKTNIIKINNVIEDRRGRKLVNGDKVVIKEKNFLICEKTT